MQFEIDIPKDKTNVFENYVPIIKSKKEKVIHVYLTDGIEIPSNYNELCFTLEQAKPDSTVYLILNTPGGHVDSAIQIRNSINLCKGTTIAIVTGSVSSAGTMITLACDKLEVRPNASFMCHEVSMDGIGGKFSDIVNMQTFYKKQFELLTKNVYEGFLTKEEINLLHSGKEIWLNQEDINTRWDKYVIFRNENYTN